MRENLVVDASALIALLIDGGDAGTWVATRLEHATLHAPDHLMIETMNVIRRRRNAALLSPTQASQAFSGAGDLPITLWPWSATAARAWELGANLSSYDAAYVALAIQLNATLITLDSRLARAPGVSCRIEAPDL